MVVNGVMSNPEAFAFKIVVFLRKSSVLLKYLLSYFVIVCVRFLFFFSTKMDIGHFGMKRAQMLSPRVITESVSNPDFKKKEVVQIPATSCSDNE